MIKKTTAIVAVVLFVILFTAGSVTAALALRSSTTVEKNDISSEYITLTSSEYTDFLDAVSFDTVVTSSGVTYNIHSDGSKLSGSVLASKEFVMSVDRSTAALGSSYDLEVSVSKFSPITGLTYTFTAWSIDNNRQANEVVSNDDVTYTAEGQEYKWTMTGLEYETDYIIALYVGGSVTSMDPTIGFTNYAAGTEDGSIFTFTAVNYVAP